MSPRSSTNPVAGVDGYRRGWVVATLTGRQATLALQPSAADVLAATQGCAYVAVDIPMGLAEEGRRACDTAAQAVLGRARASVFPAPHRWMLAARRAGLDHAAVLAQARAQGRAAISAQGFGLIDKIIEWDDLLVADPTRQERVAEAHPELSFRASAGDPRTTMAGKKTATGTLRRLALLRGQLDLDDALAGLPADPAGPALDDVLDALVLTWTAQRLLAGTARPVSAPDTRDRHGLLMRIMV